MDTLYFQEFSKKSGGGKKVSEGRKPMSADYGVLAYIILYGRIHMQKHEHTKAVSHADDRCLIFRHGLHGFHGYI